MQEPKKKKLRPFDEHSYSKMLDAFRTMGNHKAVMILRGLKNRLDYAKEWRDWYKAQAAEVQFVRDKLVESEQVVHKLLDDLDARDSTLAGLTKEIDTLRSRNYDLARRLDETEKEARLAVATAVNMADRQIHPPIMIKDQPDDSDYDQLYKKYREANSQIAHLHQRIKDQNIVIGEQSVVIGEQSVELSKLRSLISRAPDHDRATMEAFGKKVEVRHDGTVNVRPAPLGVTNIEDGGIVDASVQHRAENPEEEK